MANWHIERYTHITNHFRNANKIHNEILLTPIEWLSSKIQDIRLVKDMGDRESLYTVAGSVNYCSHYGKEQISSES